LVISQASKSSGPIAIPKLLYSFLSYVNVFALIKIESTILTTKKITETTIMTPMIVVQIVWLILADDSLMVIPMYRIERST
jgi:hypothetical protein